jgi:hypothetical protein
MKYFTDVDILAVLLTRRGGAVAAVSLALTPTSALAQTDWFCEAKTWMRTNATSFYNRNKNEGEDNFRIKIVSPSSVRITGSDSLQNGVHIVTKKGSKYYFSQWRPRANPYFGARTAHGVPFFDSANGKLYFESRGPYIMGMESFLWTDGNCE